MDDDMLTYEGDEDDETKWLPSNDVINTTNESELSSVSYMPNSTNSWPSPSSAGVSGLTVALVLVYGVICVAGLIGNLLVVYVVARHTRMKTATNVYIMNLSVADALFLVGLPMIMTTSILRYWVFGQILCKVYYVLTCVNTFTGTFTLTLMSADRFVAVWYPIKSLKYRTPKYAAAEAVATWFLSAIVMSPIVLYADAVPNYLNSMSCQVRFPVAHAITTARIYVVYTLIVGFLLPVTCITIFYALLVFRLRNNRDQIRAAGKRRRQLRHRNVTALVTLVIAVYVICWLPYWGFQMDLVFNSKDGSQWRIILFQFFTVLTYSNSAINPLLYAFTNENFKKAFVGAFSCANVEFQDKHQTIEMQSKRQHRTQQEASGSKAYGREDCAKSRRRATAGFVFGRPAACIVRQGQGRSKSLVEYQFAVFKNSSNTALVNCCTSPSQPLSSTRNVDRVVEVTACSKLKEESSCSDQSVPL